MSSPAKPDDQAALGASELQQEAGGAPLSRFPFPLVGVGGSAGGMEAFTRLLESLPGDPGMSFILVMHLDPHHESLLSSILARSTAMKVHEAKDAQPVEVNTVYVIPPNAVLTLHDGTLQVRERTSPRAGNMPVDHLFRSLASVQANRSIGVVLSGGGTDGTLGLQEINASAGITFVQDPRTARQDSMPRSAAATGAADFILSPEEIARELLRIARHPFETEPDAHAPILDGNELDQVFALLRDVKDMDFSQYKRSTINRRIRRRAALKNFEHLSDYVKYLRENPGELQDLYQDFLIRVTSFFRDPAAFLALREKVLPRLFQDRPREKPVRVWVAGCATGEEVYSIAITILEYLADLGVSTPLKILATDINEAALEKARSGAYIENIELDVSPDRLRRFFTKVDGYYHILKSIRDVCVFARHNLVRDPPFSHVDLVTCRNVLIYMDTLLQRRVIPTFHYSLRAPGFLMLGSAESVGTFGELFEPVDDKLKIYSKKTVVIAPPLFHFEMPTTARPPAMGLAISEPLPITSPQDVLKEADRLVLQRYSPPGVVVDENFNILQFRGKTSAFLEHGSGAANLNLLRMVREGLAIELRKALDQAKRDNTIVRKEKLTHTQGDRMTAVAVEIVPMRVAADGHCFLVLFEEGKSIGPSTPSPRKELAPASPGPAREQRLNQLQQELDATREYLQSVIEEHETTNEELKSAHEEILSSNEELQSTNEELQTAKEEMQSANEELGTVNEELRFRNRELGQLNDALVNLLGGVNIPIVIVGRNLEIRRLTPLAEKVFNLLPSDIGRGIGDIRPNIDLPNFDKLITEVIDSLESKEIEARDREGRWWSIRIRPYITQDKKIDGASIVALEIDALKRSLEQAQQLASEQGARAEAEAANRAKDEFLAMLAHELRNPLGPLTNVLQLLHHRPGADAAQRDLIEMGQRQVRHLARMLEDLLDVSRISRGKIQLKKEWLGVAALVNRVVEVIRPPLEKAGLQLDVSVPPSTVLMEADAVRLEQVLVNLMNNAIKYTPNGGSIELKAEQVDQTIVFRVKDTGIGIAPAMLPQVFNLFTQAEKTLDRARGGLGIGLTLVKRLVELHEGTVAARSAGEGQGSEFIVRLPMGEQAPARDGESKHRGDYPKVPPRRVLIVDDSRDAADSLAIVLRDMGHEVRVAYDGPGGLQAAEKEPPQVALLDIGLPGMDGYELARQFRRQPHLKNTLLIALTGYGREENRQLSREAGFHHHVVKPAQPDDLQRLMAQLPGEKQEGKA